MDFLIAFWDSMSYQLVSTLGSVAGAIVQVLLYLFVSYTRKELPNKKGDR